MLIYPVVKRAVAAMARLTAWGYVLLALLWLGGLGLILTAANFDEAGAGAASGVLVLSMACLVWLRVGLESLLLPCLYVSALWCHHVLLAQRGVVVTRWLLLFLLFFAFLHPVCELYTCCTGNTLLANQFLLPAVLYGALVAAFAFNWFCMAALPLHLRLCLLAFGLCLLGQYILGGSVLLLLLPCFCFVPLYRLAQLAPLVVSLPPMEHEPKSSL